jgi:hypothetical protein
MSVRLPIFDRLCLRGCPAAAAAALGRPAADTSPLACGCGQRAVVGPRSEPGTTAGASARCRDLPALGGEGAGHRRLAA